MGSFIQDTTDTTHDPYVAIRHVPSRAWAEQRLEVFSPSYLKNSTGRGGERMAEDRLLAALASKRSTRYLLHVGVMASYESINGQLADDDDAWPKPRNIREIFSLKPGILSVVHYVDAGNHTKQADLEELISLSGFTDLGKDVVLNQGFQFEQCWASLDHVKQVQQSNARLRIILEIGEQALKEEQDNAKRIVARLRQYRPHVHDVVIDMRTAKHRLKEVPFLRDLIGSVRDAFPDLGVGVAGGLGLDTLTHIDPLLQAFSGLSIEYKEQCSSHSQVTASDRESRVDAVLRRTSLRLNSISAK